jgi:hypothetical protein
MKAVDSSWVSREGNRRNRGVRVYLTFRIRTAKRGDGGQIGVTRHADWAAVERAAYGSGRRTIVAVFNTWERESPSSRGASSAGF